MKRAPKPTVKPTRVPRVLSPAQLQDVVAGTDPVKSTETVDNWRVQR